MDLSSPNRKAKRQRVEAPTPESPDFPLSQGKGRRSSRTSLGDHTTAGKTQGSSRTVPDHQPISPDDVAIPAGVDADLVVPKKEPEEDTDALMAQVPVDAGAEMAAEAKSKPTERPAIREEREGVIRFVACSSSVPSAATYIVLTGLKGVFQKQLPKMPREYISRLVYDRNHWSMAIVKRGFQVVGGITYRPFESREFGEIVFCAVTSTEQVKGYGSHLMNHLKDYVRQAHPTLRHFLTYADNYAFGYFKKQGFTKEITLDRSVWAGYIKDYEGATPMQCTMVPRIEYLKVSRILAMQKEAILAKIKETSKSHVVYSGRELFGDGRTSIDSNEVPGLREIGWTPEMDALTRRPERGPDHAVMQRLLVDMQNHPAAWAFARPVNKEEVSDYYDIIKHPMDLETMEVKLEANQYAAEGLKLFLSDAQLIFDNCRQYNSEGSNYAKNATKLEKYLKERLATYV